MTLKASFASVLRAMSSKRNITQRDFADTTSRTYLFKLELGKSSITLDKLDQICRRLELSPLTLLTLTLSEETGKYALQLVSQLRAEITGLQHEDGMPGLRVTSETSNEGLRLARGARANNQRNPGQVELLFAD